MPFWRRNRAISILVGSLLLLAAGLKLLGLAMSPIGSVGFLAAPELQMAAIELEALLALWLLSGKNPVGAWLTTMLVFACFAALSLYQGWTGQASCSCFGKLISFSPWYAFGLDVAVLTTLSICRPNFELFWMNPRPLLATTAKTVIIGMAAAGLLLGGMMATNWLPTFQPQRTFREVVRWHGPAYEVKPPRAFFGVVHSDNGRMEKRIIINRIDALPFNILKATASDPAITCSFQARDTQQQVIGVTLDTAQVNGRLYGELILRTDHAQVPEIKIPFVAIKQPTPATTDGSLKKEVSRQR